ncbi:hypothetical protein H7Y63_03345 [Polaromonas sp.]|nr:hypothetical protein [Candidatus Saccharibacteria bacterium]
MHKDTPNYLRIVAVSTALGAMIGGCSLRGQNTETESFCSEPVEVGTYANGNLRDSMEDLHGLDPKRFEDVAETSGKAVKALAKKRNNSTHTVYPHDSFRYCVNGSKVHLDKPETLILEEDH